MTQGIFVSYRRDDTRHVAGRLAGDLAERFGQDSIFRDVESIEGGEEFPVMLEKALEQCAMMLVLIGPKWLAAADAQGQRRLDNPADWVRQEISVALHRGIRVVPVLVEGATLPGEADLPDDLKPLVRRQVRQLSDERWRGDLMMLVEMLAKVPGLKVQDDPAGHAAAPAPVATAKSSSRIKLIGGGMLLAMAAAVVGSNFISDGIQDVSGTWRSNTQYSYTFEQSGREVQITTKVDGAAMGTGSGRLEGDVLKLVFTTKTNEGEHFTENCELTADAGLTRFEGQCTPVGRPPYRYFILR